MLLSCSNSTRTFYRPVRAPSPWRGSSGGRGSPGCANALSINSPEETPNPRRDSKKTGRYHVLYCLWCVLTIQHMVSPCFLGVSSWIWSLFLGIIGYCWSVRRSYVLIYTFAANHTAASWPDIQTHDVTHRFDHGSTALSSIVISVSTWIVTVSSCVGLRHVFWLGLFYY